jgi:hypothetical protein
MNDPEEWGEEIPADQVVNPIVFHFRPTQFVPTAPEDRQVWEQFFTENVGFPPPAPAMASVTAQPAPYPNGGESGSNNGWDD